MENQIAVVNEMNLVADLDAARQQVFCSFPTDTKEEKARLYNVSSNPDFKIAEVVGQEINVKDIYCEIASVVNRDTGEVSQLPRVVLIAHDGKSYASVSNGIFNAVRKLIQVFGMPTWDDPVAVRVKQINIGKNRMYTLEVIE